MKRLLEYAANSLPVLAFRLLAELWRIGFFGRAPVSGLRHLFAAWRRCGPCLAMLAHYSARRFPHRTAVLDDAGRLSFAELDARSERLARELHDGLDGPGAIAILCRNHRGAALALLAASRLRHDSLLLNSDFSAPQLANLFARQRIAGVVCDRALQPLLAAAGYHGRQWLTDAADDIDAPHPPDDRRVPAPRPPRPLRHGRLIVLTSGSSGDPKPIARRLSLRAPLGACLSLLRALPVRMHAPTLVGTPLYHGFGLATWAMTLMLAAPALLRPRLDAYTDLVLLARHRIRIAAVVPTQLHRLTQARQSATTLPLRLQALVCGSAPLSPTHCQEAVQAFGAIVFNLYGSSEAGLCTLATPADLSAAPGCVGHPVHGTTLWIAAASGRRCAAGVIGHVRIDSALATSAGRRRQALDTGDLGRLDLAGRLHLAGRSDRMIVSGGENIYPEQVEAALLAHAGVADAWVRPQPDPVYGTVLHAQVQPRPGRSDALDEATLLRFLAPRLPRYALPKRVHIIAALERNALGKLRHAARTEASGARV